MIDRVDLDEGLFFPSIHDLFVECDLLYFNCRLSAVTVGWSSRMTRCAGLCYYHGKAGSCSIKLSEPLLKFRPLSDLISTLLHEMIHAYLFLVEGTRDREGHGEKFIFLMNKINLQAGSNITVHHSFHEEVDYYKTHVWRCSGPCKDQPPWYGWVKRSVNRRPQPADFWWKSHKMACGGEFEKISSPGSATISSARENADNETLKRWKSAGRRLGGSADGSPKIASPAAGRFGTESAVHEIQDE